MLTQFSLMIYDKSAINDRVRLSTDRVRTAHVYASQIQTSFKNTNQTSGICLLFSSMLWIRNDFVRMRILLSGRSGS